MWKDRDICACGNHEGQLTCVEATFQGFEPTSMPQFVIVQTFINQLVAKVPQK